ncbi:MAG: T9SS type A sorting domain-containing protein [Bacteroidales bacterium]
MKKILFIALLAYGMNAKAQITMEHHYPPVGIYTYLSYTILSTCEFKYYMVDNIGNTLTLYNVDHSIYKSITIPPQPISSSNYYFISAVSNMIFDTDSSTVEYILYGIDTIHTPPNNFYLNIYTENGSILYADTAIEISGIIDNIQFFNPTRIFNTPTGLKLILQCMDGSSKVFSLPGELPQNCPLMSGFNENNNFEMSNAFPNPTSEFITIPYTLPNSVNQGIIVFYNLIGNEVKRFKVDRTFNSLHISTTDLAAGTYYYQLQTAAQNSEGKKIIVIK